MSNQFEKTVFLVTGVGHGIGRKFAETIGKNLSADSLLIVQSRSDSGLEQLKREIHKENKNANISCVNWDLSDPKSIPIEKDLRDSVKSAHLIPTSSFQRAIIVHNAARLGSMQTKIIDMNDPAELQLQLNINVVSMLVINSIFHEVFQQVKSKIILNMTAPSATKPNISFGMTSLCKAPRQLTLSILAKESPEIKVLHFDPGCVDTESLRAIRDESYDPNIRTWAQSWYEDGSVLPVDQVVSSMIKVLREEKSYESASYLSVYDLLKGK